jgi:HK97 family phage prohead protease
MDELEMRAKAGDLETGDFVAWQSSGGTARGRVTRIVTEGRLPVPDTDLAINATEDDPAALIRIYRPRNDGWLPTRTLVGHKFSTLTKIDALEAPSEDRALCEDCDGNCEVCQTETREVNLTPPAYMRAAARQGLRYYEEGKAGDGLVEKTVREARAMAAGNVTADKWVRIAAWIARHMVDLDAPAARPDSPDYPSAGVVAHLLWGSGPSKASARRAMEYAEGVVARIEAENEGRAKGEALSKMETRTNITQIEVREAAEGMTFTGYAAIFDSPSEPLPFTETIQRGAFKRSLRARNDIKFLWNHDVGEILGSTRAKTLKLYEDERGLRVEGILPNTSRGRDVAELLRRGDVDSMSFGFSVIKDDWSSDGSQRTLKDVRLFEVSLVSYPAYSATAGTVAVRGLDQVAERSGVNADALADALLKVEDGQSITTEESEMLSRVIGELAPKPESEEAKGDLNMLALKKAKLALLTKGII